MQHHQHQQQERESAYDSLSRDAVGTAASLAIMMERERTAYARSDYLRRDDASVTESDRRELVDWCYGVVDQLRLERETVAVAMDMADRFLSLTSHGLAHLMRRDRVEFQLLAMTALYASVKVHERTALSSDFFAEMSRGAYAVEEIESAERALLEGLGWWACPPTVVQVANHVLSLAAPHCVDLTESTWGAILDEVRYQAECAVRDYRLSLRRPSTVAVAAVFNSLDRVSERERRAVLRALIHVLHDDFDPPEDLLAARDDLRALVAEDDDGPAASDERSVSSGETVPGMDVAGHPLQDCHAGGTSAASPRAERSPCGVA